MYATCINKITRYDNGAEGWMANGFVPMSAINERRTPRVYATRAELVAALVEGGVTEAQDCTIPTPAGQAFPTISLTA